VAKIARTGADVRKRDAKGNAKRRMRRARIWRSLWRLFGDLRAEARTVRGGKGSGRRVVSSKGSSAPKRGGAKRSGNGGGGMGGGGGGFTGGGAGDDWDTFADPYAAYTQDDARRLATDQDRRSGAWTTQDPDPDPDGNDLNQDTDLDADLDAGDEGALDTEVGAVDGGGPGGGDAA
jgi:hypothetical protein